MAKDKRPRDRALAVALGFGGGQAVLVLLATTGTPPLVCLLLSLALSVALFVYVLSEESAAEDQRERLAALGVVVGKISHDLRNSLATAQLVAGRFAEAADERLRLAAPRLERALLKATALAESAAEYAKGEEPSPALVRLPVRRAFAKALATLPPMDRGRIQIDIPPLFVLGDPAFLHRLLLLLLLERLAVAPEGVVCVRGEREGDTVRLDLRLTTPLGDVSAPDDHTALRRMIAMEFARLQGGDVQTARDGETSALRITLPAA